MAAAAAATESSFSFSASDRSALLSLCASLHDRGSEQLQAKINKYVSLSLSLARKRSYGMFTRKKVEIFSSYLRKFWHVGFIFCFSPALFAERKLLRIEGSGREGEENE